MLEWIVTSSFLILVVLALRAALGKKISAGLRYMLWAVVLVRLLLPVSLFSLHVHVGISQIPEWTPSEAMREESIYLLPVGSAPLESSGVHVTEDGTLADSGSFGYPRLTDDGERVVRYAEKISLIELLGWVWLAGAAVMGVVLITANLRFFIRLRRARRSLEGISAPIPVYVMEKLPSPCLTGLLRPAVYVTREAAENPTMLRHVLAHELTHYNHRDHLWSVLRGAALAIHWWNPLVWLAVVCSRRDGELACDEGALERLGDGERTAYGETLLALVTAKSTPGDLLSFATTMTGGKRSLKERIQRIARQPKQLVSAMVVVTLVITLSALVAFGQAKEESAPRVSGDSGTPESPSAKSVDAWRNAEISVDENGVPHIDYDGETMTGNPIPAPKEWADEDLAGRNKATALEFSRDIWAGLVSKTEGWLVACYERGVAAADTYVYKTADGGMNWTEVSMPGTSWHIADVGFLSPDRLIVAQRLFDGAPCFITKDGGETWEEIELPDTVVTAIHSETVTMFVGPNESDPDTFVMTSEDLGDHWTVMPIKMSQSLRADLDHDGAADTLTVRQTGEGTLEAWTLEYTASGMSAPAWEGEAYAAHVGWTAFFLYRLEGEDYLLEYSPWMGGGACQYTYKLFYLTAGGEEIAVRENAVEFDLIFSPDYADQHQYDPWAINAFMEEINALLAKSEVLVNTDQNLLGTFQKEGRLYDSVWWLDDDRDDDLSLLDNLLNYGNYAQDHPDDVWSPLADVLMDMTEGDIESFEGDKSALLNLLKKAERGSRFYTWDSYEEACDGHGVGEADYVTLNLPLKDGGALWLLACDEKPSVLVIYETPEETVSAFYTAPELKELIQNEKEIPLTQVKGAAASKLGEPVRSEEVSPDSQARQYYEAGSLPLFQIAFSRLDGEAQGKWLEKIYTDGDIAFFSAAVRGLDANSPLIADLAEEVYADEDIAFFSTLADCMDEAELELWLDRALEDENWTFQSVLFDRLDKDDEFDSLKEENEKKWAEAQTAAYQAAGVTMDGKNYYYQGQLVNIFLDIRANKSFYTLDLNPAGTVNIKMIRNEKDEITGVDYMTEAEVTELLDDMDDPDSAGTETTIPVELKSVAAGETIFLGEYTLSEGDTIEYDISAEVGNRMKVFFAKDEQKNPVYWSVNNLRQPGEPLKCTADFTVESPAKPGTYQLYIQAPDGALGNVRGNILLA